MAENGNAYLYLMVEQQIEADIQNQVYAENQQLPTEAELCELYHVSRVTVRRAVHDLVEKKVLETKRGKGIFVRKQRIDHILFGGNSFSETCRNNGKVPSSKVLQISIQRPVKEDLQFLHVSPEDKVLFIRRVLCADGVPTMVEYNYFPPRFLGLIRHPLENASLYRILREEYGIEGVTTETTIELSTVSSDDAKELGLKPNSAVLLTTEVNYDSRTGAPIHRTRQVILGKGWIYNVRNHKKV